MHKKNLLLLPLLLAGCTMIPDYTPAELPVAKQWPGQQTESEEKSDASEVKTPVAQIAWNDFFKSPVLQNVLRAALENNRDLRVAALNVEAARSAYGIERANLLPSVNGDITGLKQKTLPGASGRAANEIYTAQVNASYELDFFGRIRSLNEAALESFLASEDARKAVQVSLLAETANAYLQLQADRELLKLTKSTLEAQEKSSNLINQRFNRGIGSRLDVAQALIPLEQARANLALYTRLVAQDKNALILLIGKQDADSLLAEQNLDSIELMKELPVGLPSEILLSRPDISEAEHNLLSANANIGAARANFFPRISLTGSYGQASVQLSDLFKSAAGTVWSFAPQVSLPIFQGGANIANLNLSETNRDIAVANYEKSIQAAFREVADQLAARATLDQQLKAQQNLVKASQDAYNLSGARYRLGTDSFLSVLDAQRSLFTAQQAEIDIRKQRLANMVNLYKALGGGQTGGASIEPAAYTWE
jgi:multidrug efflux system outer membrane protein